MKAYVVDGIRKGSVREVKMPKIGSSDVLIKVMAAGICGTDGHIYKGEYFSSFPLIPGHEFSGVVVKIGDKVRCFKVGDRVAADPNIFCEKCDFCKQNLQNFCLDFEAVGVTRDGAFAEFVSCPEACVFDIGDIDFLAASLIEPLSCAVYGQTKARPAIGDCILIFGAGPIGLLHLQLAKHNGAAFVAVTDLKEDRLELARKLGADFTMISNENLASKITEKFPQGFNIVIDCTGVPSVIEKEIYFVRNAGTLLIFGVSPKDSSIAISPYEIFKRELKIVGSFALKKTFQPAINLLKSGAIDVECLIGDRITLDMLPDKMEDFINGNTLMKTVVYSQSVQL